MRAESLCICREEEGVMIYPLLLSVDMHKSGHVGIIGSRENIRCFQVEVLGEEVEGALEVADEAALQEQASD